MPQACAFCLAAAQVCASILLGDRPFDIIVFLRAAVRHLNMDRLWACYLKEEFGGVCEYFSLVQGICRGEIRLRLALLVVRRISRFHIGERIGRCLLTL